MKVVVPKNFMAQPWYIRALLAVARVAEHWAAYLAVKLDGASIVELKAGDDMVTVVRKRRISHLNITGA